MPNIIPEVTINMNWLTPDKKYKNLLLKSITHQLSMEETKEIIDFIKVSTCSPILFIVKPESFGEIIRNNKDVAKEFIIAINSHSNVGDYYERIGEQEPSLPLIEFLISLKSEVEVPTVISHSVAYTFLGSIYERSEKNEPSERLIKISAHFIDSLLKSDMNTNYSFSSEKEFTGKLEQFCIDYSNYKEVLTLQRTLKTMKKNQAPNNS